MNKKLFFTSLMVLFLFFTAYSQSSTLRRVASIKAELRAEPNDYFGTFPVIIKLKGKITAQHQGIVKYKYIWNDGSSSNVFSLTFTTPGIKNLSYSRSFSAPAAGWVKIRLLSPINISSNLANYSLKQKLILSGDPLNKTYKPKLKIKPKKHMMAKLSIKKLPNWKKIAESILPDLIIQSFKSKGPVGVLGEVSRLEAVVANIGNVRSGKCELAVSMYVPENIPKTEDNCPGCVFTYRYDIPELDPGTSCAIEASWIFNSGPGLWKFRAKADYVRLKSKGVVAEINEDNNRAKTYLIMHY